MLWQKRSIKQTIFKLSKHIKKTIFWQKRNIRHSMFWQKRNKTKTIFWQKRKINITQNKHFKTHTITVSIC